MLDLSPIASAIKMLQQPPPQVMPLVAKAMKPVRDSETLAAVPPPPKSGRSGLGGHMDLYDTDSGTFRAASGAPVPEEQIVLSEDSPDKLPQAAVPDTAPPIDLPFLKPLGPELGRTFDAIV